MPEGFFVTESCMIRDLGYTDFGTLLDETLRQCLLSDADNTDMDMADVEIGAGCCQQAAKGGVCIANTVLGVTL